MQIFDIYQKLYKAYGPQGWWPFLGIGYHKLDYTYPKNSDQIFEVALGSILTQNTTFTSVERSLENLSKLDALNPKNLKKLPIDQLKIAIKPSGYFNQKANYILNFLDFFEKLDGKIPKRDELLKVKGVGEETADSILLFGYNQLEFKVDAYTKRLFINLKLVDENIKYKQLKDMIEDDLKSSIKDDSELLKIYLEFHPPDLAHKTIINPLSKGFYFLFRHYKAYKV